MTLVDKGEYGKPPEYPTDSMVPKEFWRKQPGANPDAVQTITIDTPEGPVKRVVQRNWENPVYIGPREDDPRHGLSQRSGEA